MKKKAKIKSAKDRSNISVDLNSEQKKTLQRLAKKSDSKFTDYLRDVFRHFAHAEVIFVRTPRTCNPNSNLENIGIPSIKTS